MILEYLFFDKSQKQNVEAFNRELEASNTDDGKNPSIQKVIPILRRCLLSPAK